MSLQSSDRYLSLLKVSMSNKFAAVKKKTLLEHFHHIKCTLTPGNNFVPTNTIRIFSKLPYEGFCRSTAFVAVRSLKMAVKLKRF